MRDEYAGNLSGGQKRLLELARAVMAEPRMLILDEPMAGINPALVDRICEHISEIRASLGVTILIVEHSLDVVERITDHVVVMAASSALATATIGHAARQQALRLAPRPSRRPRG